MRSSDDSGEASWLSRGMPNDEVPGSNRRSKGSTSSADSANELRDNVGTFQNLANGVGSSSNTGMCRMHDIGVASSQGITWLSGSETPESIGPKLPRI